MEIICKKGGLVGNFPNHSGKRTCASQLYSDGMDDQAIMERTGICQSGLSVSTSDLVLKYLKMGVKFWIFLHRKY